MSTTIAIDFINFLSHQNINTSFGVSGGAVLPIWHALSESKDITNHHCRHESGAVFSASEYSISNNLPAVAFATPGPGMSNALTALRAAKLDGSRVIFISSLTVKVRDGRWGLHETTEESAGLLGDHNGQGYFDEIYCISTKDDYLAALHSIEASLTKHEKTGVVMGVFMSPGAMKQNIEPTKRHTSSVKSVSKNISPDNSSHIKKIATSIDENTVFWVGFGAREGAGPLKSILEKTGSLCMSTPRGKGILDGRHPLNLGITGLGSDAKLLLHTLESGKINKIIILGSRLSELSSSYIQQHTGKAEIFYVGINSEELKKNLPSGAVLIESDVRQFLSELNKKIPGSPRTFTKSTAVTAELENSLPSTETQLHPLTVMKAIQDIAIDQFDCFVAADAGNSLVWANRYLKFAKPLRYRASTSYGSMGHYACGLVGLTANKQHVAVGIIGDGAMLMNNEVNTAVRYQLPAIWLIMNDASYNMCRQAADLLGKSPIDCEIPMVDFKKFGDALGATGFRATNDAELRSALTEAIKRKRPAVIDVVIDRTVVPPLDARIASLKTAK